MTNAFTYAELDEILRGTGRGGAIGMSAIDGLIAALVAAPDGPPAAVDTREYLVGCEEPLSDGFFRPVGRQVAL